MRHAAALGLYLRIFVVFALFALLSHHTLFSDPLNAFAMLSNILRWYSPLQIAFARSASIAPLTLRISLAFTSPSFATHRRASGTHSHPNVVRFNWFHHLSLFYFTLYHFFYLYIPILFRFYSFCFASVRSSLPCFGALFYIHFILFPIIWLPTLVPCHAESFPALLFHSDRVFTCFGSALVRVCTYLFRTPSIIILDILHLFWCAHITISFLYIPSVSSSFPL